jgi:hypothetical protein
VKAKSVTELVSQSAHDQLRLAVRLSNAAHPMPNHVDNVFKWHFSSRPFSRKEIVSLSVVYSNVCMPAPTKKQPPVEASG